MTCRCGLNFLTVHGLFIDTEDRCMRRGLQIQTNDFGCFALKIRIGAELVATQSVRLQTLPWPTPVRFSCAW